MHAASLSAVSRPASHAHTLTADPGRASDDTFTTSPTAPAIIGRPDGPTVPVSRRLGAGGRAPSSTSSPTPTPGAGRLRLLAAMRGLPHGRDSSHTRGVRGAAGPPQCALARWL